MPVSEPPQLFLGWLSKIKSTWFQNNEVNNLFFFSIFRLLTSLFVNEDVMKNSKPCKFLIIPKEQLCQVSHPGRAPFSQTSSKLCFSRERFKVLLCNVITCKPQTLMSDISGTKGQIYMHFFLFVHLSELNNTY